MLTDFRNAPAAHAHLFVKRRVRSSSDTASGASWVGRRFRAMVTRSGLVLGLAVAACTRTHVHSIYAPQTREFTVTTVPLLVREGQSLYPFLKPDFTRGGVLEGKEVYAFSPSTLVAVVGDTIRFSFVNPEDDEHSFFLPGCTDDLGDSFVPPNCVVKLPGQSVTSAMHVVHRAGVYPFWCTVPTHLPMMWGQLVVLSPATVAGTSGVEVGIEAKPARGNR